MIKENAPKRATHYRVKADGKVVYYVFKRGELLMMRKNKNFMLSVFGVNFKDIKPL